MKWLHLEKLKDNYPHQCKEKTQAGNFRDETGKMTSELRIDTNARNNINLKTGTPVQYPGK